MGHHTLWLSHLAVPLASWQKAQAGWEGEGPTSLADCKKEIERPLEEVEHGLKEVWLMAADG